MRESWVDYAKGIGIILVVFGHVNRGLYSSGIYLSEGIYKTIDNFIYSFHMPLFFFLSGLFFIQSIDRRGRKDFIISKIDTIIYPYIVWSLLQGGIEVLLSQYTNSKTSISSVLSLLTEPRAQFWFLYALFMVFFFLTILYNKKAFTNYLPALILTTLLLNIYRNNLTFHFHFIYLSTYLFFFMTGVMFQKHIEKIERFTNGLSLSIVLIVFFMFETLFLSNSKNSYNDAGLETAALAIAGILLIVTLSIYLTKYKINILRKLGEQSMMIYLMHILAASGIRIMISKFAHTNNWYAHALVGTLCGILLPVLAVIILRRCNINFLFSRPKIKA